MTSSRSAAAPPPVSQPLLRAGAACLALLLLLAALLVARPATAATRTLKITGRPAASSTSRTIVVRFSAPRHARVICRLDARPPRRCTSPFRVARLALGRHTLRVRLASSSKGRVLRFRIQAPVLTPTGATGVDTTVVTPPVVQAGAGTGAGASTTPVVGGPVADPGTHPVGDAAALTGTLLYVAPNGSDAAAGTVAAPLLTLARATAVAGPDTTVVLRGGTYAGFDVQSSGTPGHPITYTSFPGESGVVSAGGRASTIVVAGRHDLVFSRLTIADSTGGESSGGVFVSAGAARVRILDSRIAGNAAYGINVYDSTAVDIERDTIADNATGIQIRDVAYWVNHAAARSADIAIAGNLLVDNNRMRVNTPSPNYDDTGAQGIVFNLTNGPIAVTGNVIAGSTALSYDYGRDGTALEVFGASNLTITGNTLAGNMMALEIGTQPSHATCVARAMGWCWSDVYNGGASPVASDIAFTGNLVYGGDDKSQVYAHTANPQSNLKSLGVLVHCGTNLTIAGNTIDGMDNWAFWFDASDVYATPFVNVRVQNNIISSDGDQIYSVGRGVALDQLAIGGNVVWKYGGTGFGTFAPTSGAMLDFATFRAQSGLAATDRLLDPEFVARFAWAPTPAVPDYHLRAGSPAIGSAVAVAGVGATTNVGAF